MDWSVHKGSRIEKMPRIAQPFAILARELKPPMLIDYHHRADHVATKHNDRFKADPRYRKALARANKAGGYDYGIPYRVHQALWCSRQAQKVDGDFVEFGTGRGYIMSAILEDFDVWTSSGREAHLFDTFSSVYVDKAGDQKAGVTSARYAESAEKTVENFRQWPRVTAHVGNVFDTLPKAPFRQVAFCHIDMNSPEPEIFAFRTVWPLLPRGGVILLDDYAYHGHDRQYDAMNALAREYDFDILSTPSGQGIIIR